MEQQLYGNRHRRMHAATLASLKPSGGRFSAASNFATATPQPPAPDIGGKRKKRKKAGASPAKDASANFSSLERMAAKIMKKKR